MAGQTLSLTIATQLQKAGFTEAAEQMRNLQNQVDGVKKSTGGWEDATNKLKDTLLKLGTVEFYREAADEAGKAEEAQNRLATSVENAGASWTKNRDQINATNAALADTSRFAKGDIDNALNILIQRTNNVAVSQANLQTVMGISVKTGRDLADVADQIGRAANGSIRDTQQLGKEFGISGENAKNATYVLDQLSKKFGDSAENEKSYTKTTMQMNNAWMDLKETFGKLLLPAIEDIEEALTRLAKSVTATLEMLGHLGDATYDLFAGNFKKAAAEGKAAGADFVKQWTALFTKDVPDAVKTGGDKTTAAAHQLRDQLLDFTKNTEADAAKILSQIGLNAQQQAHAAGEAEKIQIQKRTDFIILNAKDQARVLLAIDMDTAAKEKAIQQDKILAMTNRYLNYATAIGAAAGAMVNGQQDAWKQVLDVVIDSLTAELTAVLVTTQAEAIAREVAAGGWYGFIAGAAQAAGIAALGAAAKAALRGGGGSSGSIASSAGSYANGGSNAGGGAATSSNSATNGPVTNVRIVVQGDMINDPAFTDRLVRKITESVENRGTRLVATQVA